MCVFNKGCIQSCGIARTAFWTNTRRLNAVGLHRGQYFDKKGKGRIHAYQHKHGKGPHRDPPCLMSSVVVSLTALIHESTRRLQAATRFTWLHWQRSVCSCAPYCGIFLCTLTYSWSYVLAYACFKFSCLRKCVNWALLDFWETMLSAQLYPIRVSSGDIFLCSIRHHIQPCKHANTESACE